MSIAIYEDVATGRHHWAEATSKSTQEKLAAGTWVLFDATPDDPPPPGDPLDNAVSDLLDIGSTSKTSARLRAAFVAGRVYNNDGSANTTKKLHVKLTADGLDIDDLIIEDVA